MKTQESVMTTRKKNVVEEDAAEGFVARTYDIDNTHGFQFYVDGGVTPGPWLGIGVNSTLYCLGWIPEGYPHVIVKH